MLENEPNTFILVRQQMSFKVNVINDNRYFLSILLQIANRQSKKKGIPLEIFQSSIRKKYGRSFRQNSLLIWKWLFIIWISRSPKLISRKCRLSLIVFALKNICYQHIQNLMCIIMQLLRSCYQWNIPTKFHRKANRIF